MLEDLELQELYQSLIYENDNFDVILLYYNNNPKNSYLRKCGWVILEPGGNNNYKLIIINNIMYALRVDVIIIYNNISINANKIFDTTHLLFEYIDYNNIKIKS